MALFDPENPAGCELKAAYALRTIIAGLSRFQELCNVATSDDALPHITVGVFDEPTEDQAGFNADELASLGCTLIISRNQGSRLSTVDGWAQTRERGAFELLLRRHVRNNEQTQDVYLFVWDRLDAMQKELTDAIAATATYRTQAGVVQGIAGPYRSEIAAEAAQGDYIWAALQVTWGDSIEQ